MKNIKHLLIVLCLAFGIQLFSQGVDLTNLNINTEQLDFSPAPYGNGLMYTTSKSNRFLSCPTDDPGSFTDIYFAPKNADGTFGKPVALRGGVNGKYNDGVPTFNAAGDKMIFTRNNLNGKNSENIIDLKLYVADKVGEEWTNVTEFPFNSDDFSSCHPTLSRDGSLLVFASNRPDANAQGGMDLYVSRLVAGNWTQPQNLGPGVNTKGNEIFPNFDEMGHLFFSSDGHEGVGGLDIFAASMMGEQNFSLAGNIGTEFNKGGDEVAFVPMNNGSEGYIAAADRSGGKGLDDIYHWKRTPQTIPAIVVVIDENTGERLSDAVVEINPVNPGIGYDPRFGNVLDQLYHLHPEKIVAKQASFTTDANGATGIEVYNGGEYVIVASKTGYQSTTRRPTTAQLTESGEYIVPVRRTKATLVVTIVDDETGQPIPAPEIKIINKRTMQTVTLTGDQYGTVKYEIDCNDEYELVANKAPYLEGSLVLADYFAECGGGEVKRTIRLKAPVIVYLEPVYFDFDKYYIRKHDAAPTLDSLAMLMNQYPSLHVHLGAHCDARGSLGYNDILANRRSESAKKYLVGKGISADRLTTESFGERKPANDCTDRVYCPEPLHQVNRRVDVEPASHNEKGVDFKSRPIPTTVQDK